jgi:hypothetical protein
VTSKVVSGPIPRGFFTAKTRRREGAKEECAKADLRRRLFDYLLRLKGDRCWVDTDNCRHPVPALRANYRPHTAMIVAIAAALLLSLELARRGLEPECPSCAGKSWAAHSTQLHCANCGWHNED